MKARLSIVCIGLWLVNFFTFPVLAGQEVKLGIWSQSCPEQSCSPLSISDYYSQLANTLGLDAIVGYATADRLSYLQSNSLTAVGQNLGLSANPAIPELYSRVSTYSIWRAAGQPYDAIDHELTFIGGTLQGDSRYFAVGTDAAGYVMGGPNIRQIASYTYAPWNQNSLSYTSKWEMQFINDPTPATNDVVCKLQVLYDEQVIAERTIMDDEIGSSATLPMTLALQYDFNNLGISTMRTPKYVQYRLYWPANRNLLITNITVYDDLYGVKVGSNPASVAGELQTYYSNYGATPLNQVKKWVLADEINIEQQDQFLPLKLIDSLLETKSPNIESYVLAHGDPVIDYLAADIVDIDPYPFFGSACGTTPVAFTSFGNVGDSITLQQALEQYLIVPYSSATQSAKARGARVSADVQAFQDIRVSAYPPSDSVDFWRRPTARELLCNVNLALCYDIRELYLWKYSVSSYSEYCSRDDGQGARLLRGLTTHNTQGLPTLNATYYAVKDTVSPKVNQMAPALQDLEWQGACRWNYTYSNSFSPLLFVSSAEFDSAFVQIGCFKDQGDKDCVMLVNRRCLASESQTLTCWVKYTQPPFSYASNGLIFVEDLVSHDTATYANYHFDVTIGPGEAKLLRILPHRAYFGEITQDQHWTQEDSPYLVIGDLEVKPNCELTIEAGTEVKFANNTDYRAAGYDTQRSEIIVKGTLTVEGTDNDEVEFQPATAADGMEKWYGVTVEPGGKAEISFAHFKQAYRALSFGDSQESFVQNCEFDSCQMYGVYSSNPKVDILNSYFHGIGEGYAVHIFDSCTVRGNNFGDGLTTIPTALKASNSSAVIDSNYFDAAYAELGCGIEVYGNKSTTRPLKVTRAYMHNPLVGFEIGRNSNVVIDNCDLFGSLQCCLNHPYGINETMPSVAVKVTNTTIEGFNTAVSGYAGKMNLGTVVNGVGGRNVIFPECTDVHCLTYRHVYSPSLSGTLKAEDNYWAERCTPSVNPIFETDDFAELDYSPIGTFANPQSCQQDTVPGGESKLASDGPLPIQFELQQNYPNPFNPTTTISFSVPTAQYIELSIINLLGQRVRTLVAQLRAPGTYQVQWDGSDESGKTVASGIYFYHLKTEGESITKKMVILK